MHTNSVNSRLRGRQSNKPRRKFESGRKRSYQHLPKPLSRTAGTRFFSDSIPFLTCAHNTVQEILCQRTHITQLDFLGFQTPAVCEHARENVGRWDWTSCHQEGTAALYHGEGAAYEVWWRGGSFLIGQVASWYVVGDGRILNEFEWEVGGWSFSLGFTVAMTLRNIALLLLLSSQPISQYYSFKNFVRIMVSNITSPLFVQEGSLTLNMSDPFCTHSISHESTHKAGSSNTLIRYASENQNGGKIIPLFTHKVLFCENFAQNLAVSVRTGDQAGSDIWRLTASSCLFLPKNQRDTFNQY